MVGSPLDDIHACFPLQHNIPLLPAYHLFISLIAISVNAVDAASEQWKKSHAAVSELSNKHTQEMEALVRCSQSVISYFLAIASNT